MNDVAMSVVLDLVEAIRGNLPLVRLGGDCHGDNRGRGTEWKYGWKWSKSAYLPVFMSFQLMKLISND
jgi:hypothetical protein